MVKFPNSAWVVENDPPIAVLPFEWCNDVASGHFAIPSPRAHSHIPLSEIPAIQRSMFSGSSDFKIECVSNASCNEAVPPKTMAPPNIEAIACASSFPAPETDSVHCHLPSFEILETITSVVPVRPVFVLLILDELSGSIE